MAMERRIVFDLEDIIALRARCGMCDKDASVDCSSDRDRLTDVCPNCGTSWCAVDSPPRDLGSEVCTEEETLLRMIRSILSRSDGKRPGILLDFSTLVLR